LAGGLENVCGTGWEEEMAMLSASKAALMRSSSEVSLKGCEAVVRGALGAMLGCIAFAWFWVVRFGVEVEVGWTVVGGEVVVVAWRTVDVAEGCACTAVMEAGIRVDAAFEGLLDVVGAT